MERCPVANESLARSTPYLAVDLGVLDRNVAAMAKIARDRGVSLRPHVKTHKCREIASRQTGAGAVGITVATISEAEIFADTGCRDVFIAYPLWVDAARGAGCDRSVSVACSASESIPPMRRRHWLAAHQVGAISRC